MHLFLKFILEMKLYMFRTVPRVRHQELFTVHSAMVYVIQVFGQLSSSRIRMEYPLPAARKLSL
jgi:hypothetical protein